jgi:hypothetical protein
VRGAAADHPDKIPECPARRSPRVGVDCNDPINPLWSSCRRHDPYRTTSVVDDKRVPLKAQVLDESAQDVNHSGERCVAPRHPVTQPNPRCVENHDAEAIDLRPDEVTPDEAPEADVCQEQHRPSTDIGVRKGSRRGCQVRYVPRPGL